MTGSGASSSRRRSVSSGAAASRQRSAKGLVRGKGAISFVASSSPKPIAPRHTRSGEQSVSTRRVATRSTTKPGPGEGTGQAAVADRLGELLDMLTPVLPDALLAARTGGELRELAGRISSVLPQESAVAGAVGPVYETADLVSWLGISRQALHKRVQRHDLLAMKTSDGHTIYPAWQFTTDGKVRPGVAEAVKALAPAMDDWTRTLWFAGRSPDLEGQSAARWWSEGRDPAAVVTAARRRARRIAQ